MNVSGLFSSFKTKTLLGEALRCGVSKQAHLSPFANELSSLFSAKPTILVEHQSRSAAVGSQVTLTCEAIGSPQPTISWSKR